MSYRASETGSADQLVDRLYLWLESSGRALELRVTRRLRETRATVQPSVSFVDTVTGQQRETDVVAEFQWREKLHQTDDLPCSITAVVECKSGKKQPWIFFNEGGRRASLDDLADWFAWAHAPYTPVMDRLPTLWLGEEPFRGVMPATHVVAARIAKDDGDHAGGGSNPANDAVRQVLAAAEARSVRWLERQGRDPQSGLFIVPVIVTAAPLFRCSLDRDGQVLLEPVDQFEVWGSRSDGHRARVYVMNEERLPTFADALRNRAIQAAL